MSDRIGDVRFTLMSASPEAIADEVLGILRDAGSAGYHGEQVTQLQHALQTAGLAKASGADEELVLAALLHDIGHLLDDRASEEGIGVPDHDRCGGEFLRSRGFSDRLISLVEGHVAAKRFLVATNSAYRQRLSATSSRTLELQGGPMTEAEAAEFRSHELFREMLQLRSWDEQAKDPEAETAPLARYREPAVEHLKKAGLPG